jgi:hypothetical protein
MTSSSSVPVPVKGESKADVATIWQAYLAGWRDHVGSGVEPRLTRKRSAAIAARLTEYGQARVLEAIGCFWSSWQARNGFSGPDYIFRSGEQFEKICNGHRHGDGHGPAKQTEIGDKPTVDPGAEAEAMAQLEARFGHGGKK